MIDIGTYDVRGSGKGWAVWKGSECMTRTFACNYTAQGVATRLENEEKQTTRICISCPEQFISTGPHHRMCNKCRRLDHLPW